MSKKATSVVFFPEDEVAIERLKSGLGISQSEVLRFALHLTAEALPLLAVALASASSRVVLTPST